MAMTGDVGLRLLLCPLNSNIVVRTACCSVGIALPVYSTFKAIENKNRDDQQKWLLYWAAYGSFSLAEMFTDRILSWFPLYYHVKFAFLVWLQLPTSNGAKQLYRGYLRPFLLKHQARLDQVVDFLYREMNRFVSAHQAEFQFVKVLFLKIMESVNQIAHDLLRPGQRRADGAFDGRARRIRDSQADDEDED